MLVETAAEQLSAPLVAEGAPIDNGFCSGLSSFGCFFGCNSGCSSGSGSGGFGSVFGGGGIVGGAVAAFNNVLLSTLRSCVTAPTPTSAAAVRTTNNSSVGAAAAAAAAQDGRCRLPSGGHHRGGCLPWAVRCSRRSRPLRSARRFHISTGLCRTGSESLRSVGGTVQSIESGVVAYRPLC